MRQRRIWSLACAILACFCLLGCGVRSVSGKVTLDGQPLEGAGISFKASTTEQGHLEGLFVGVTDAQGNYSLRPASAKSALMLPGKYLVIVTTTYVEGGVPDDKEPPPERVPEKYRKGIEFEIPADGAINADFDLTSK